MERGQPFSLVSRAKDSTELNLESDCCWRAVGSLTHTAVGAKRSHNEESQRRSAPRCSVWETGNAPNDTSANLNGVMRCYSPIDDKEQGSTVVHVRASVFFMSRSWQTRLTQCFCFRIGSFMINSVLTSLIVFECCIVNQKYSKLFIC